MKLCLGVIEVPEPEGGDTYTTGMDLEKKYGVFSMFSNYRSKEINDAIADDAAIGIDMLIKGLSINTDKLFATSGSIVTKQLHDFITSQDVEKVAGNYGEQGIPTQAALDGLSYRFAKGVNARHWVSKGIRGEGKQKYGLRRPSFIYSGVFEASLKGWVE